MGIKEKLNRAGILYTKKEFEAAADILEKILAKKPNLFDACQLLALTLHGMGDCENAIKLFDKIIAKSPNHAASVNNLANVYNDMGQLELAERTYLKALVINQNYSDALNNLANVQRKLGKLIESEESFRKAIFSDGTKAEYYFNLGILLGEQGRFEQALNAQLKVLELDANQPAVYFHIFNNFMYLHRYQDALEFADLGLLSGRLDDFQLCELLIGKAILFWLFDNDEEGLQAIALSEMIHSVETKHLNLKNHQVFHRFIKELLHYRQSNRLSYEANEQPLIYFISESHGFAANGMTVEYQRNKHTIKSLFITGAKIFHFIQNDDHQCKASLNIVLNGLPEGSTIVVGFGEIDCRTSEGIFNYASKYNKDFHSIIDDMVEKYIQMLKQSARVNTANIIVYGVPAPHPLVLKQLTAVQEDEFKRLIAYFNLQLALCCEQNDLPFLDVYKLTNENGASNLKYHSDIFHVKPNTVPELFTLLTEDKIK